MTKEIVSFTGSAMATFVALPKHINPPRIGFTEFHVNGPIKLVVVTLAGPRLPRKLKKSIRRRFKAPVKWVKP